MGRSPDHVPGLITGFALRPDLFAQAGERFGDNVVRYHAYLRDHDLYASYVIIPPIVDRSKPAHRQDDPTLYAGVVEERPDGIVVSGAQMLGTGAAISNEIFVSCINPLQPGDENYALSFAVPAAAPGLRMIVRRPYAETAPSVYDYPLSARFDETDALVIFDQVFVPWERVFVYRNIALTRAQFYETPAHLLGNFQAQIRFAAKAEFMAGLALRIAESMGVESLRETQTLLGELASYCGMAAGLVVAAESECRHDPRGFVYPNPTYLYANNWLQATYYQTMVTYLRELSGGGLLQVPSSYRDYLNPEIAVDLERFVRSPGLTSVERVKLYKLVWDLVGSEFAGRHQQYELFYAGGRAQTTSIRVFRTFDFAAARAMVERCLAGYDLPTDPPAEEDRPS
jgi:4-hydroxyphenylacetate 3-monooxygenase